MTLCSLWPSAPFQVVDTIQNLFPCIAFAEQLQPGAEPVVARLFPGEGVRTIF